GITQRQLLYFTANKGDLALRRAYRDSEGPSSCTDYSGGLAIPYAQSIIILCDEHPIAAAQPVVLSRRSFSIGIESLLQGVIEHMCPSLALVEWTEHLNGERITPQPRWEFFSHQFHHAVDSLPRIGDFNKLTLGVDIIGQRWDDACPDGMCTGDNIAASCLTIDLSEAGDWDGLGGN